mmetsp:Transcript_1528/g.3553  ORF Transcript_1528/g.3553 Transcript_1528/m.3553 type:complete len:234 (+) Transcript_1528:302-1003(+)
MWLQSIPLRKNHTRHAQPSSYFVSFSGFFHQRKSCQSRQIFEGSLGWLKIRVKVCVSKPFFGVCCKDHGTVGVFAPVGTPAVGEHIIKDNGIAFLEQRNPMEMAGTSHVWRWLQKLIDVPLEFLEVLHDPIVGFQETRVIYREVLLHVVSFQVGSPETELGRAVLGTHSFPWKQGCEHVDGKGRQVVATNTEKPAASHVVVRNVITVSVPILGSSTGIGVNSSYVVDNHVISQ